MLSSVDLQAMELDRAEICPRSFVHLYEALIKEEGTLVSAYKIKKQKLRFDS